jgi:mono/diheme cytochrome c family protein
MTVKLRTIGIVILLTAVLIAGGAALFVYSGVYNIAASKQHTKPVYQLLEYAMRRSVKARSDSIAVPELADPQRIRSGLGHYRAHCLQCHGAPGVAPDPVAFGMTPEPVNLVSTAREWSPGEIYWVVKHGIKMSGMPAWEYRLSDQDMWDIVAFVEAMARMSTKEYAALSNEVSKSHIHQPAHENQPAAGKPSAPAPYATASAPPPAPATDPVSGPVLGDVAAGRRAAGQYLCSTCHQIPGIVGASRHVGPPLKGIANRRYIGGILINNPENMVRWLQNPQQFDPLSAMPNLGVTEKDARDIAAYLYTLEDLR